MKYRVEGAWAQLVAVAGKLLDYPKPKIGPLEA